MPRRKRSNLGRSSLEAKCTKLRRDDETSEVRDRRLENQRVSVSASRDAESIAERERRLEQARVSVSAFRDAESSDERERRLEQVRVSVSASRAAESRLENERRLLQQRARNRRNSNLRWSGKLNAAFNYDSNILYESDKVLSIGSMCVECLHCRAKKWKDETPGLCCASGKVKLTPLQEPPEPLKSLITGNSSKSKSFLSKVRNYNSAFQMTSFGANIIHEGNYMPTFKIQGQVYHSIGTLLPLNNEDHKFLQIYFMENSVKEAEVRCSNFENLDFDIVLNLQEMLHEENAYVKDFKSVIETESAKSPDFQVIIHADKIPSGAHAGRFNAPTSSEVAVLIAGQQFEKRDIVLHSRSGQLMRISETHRSYDALQYPLLFCRGEDGYSIHISQVDPATGQELTDRRKKVSCMSYYAYRLMLRTDMYAKIETERLNYIRFNQSHLRADQYIHLQDAIVQDGNVADVGQLVILPSSFTGGPRYMHEKMQDGMTYVRHYGRPDLFITFTCNRNWPEISKNLFEGQRPDDRHDIISRVFRLKVKKLLQLIIQQKIFGSTRCYMYSVEWQKRGLPHIHLLIWLQEKITPDRVDEFICAEIPSEEEDPKLFAIIKSSMVHGPCGVLNMNSPCMYDGKCSKKFPKKFVADTQTEHDGYPLYRRRSPTDGGRSFNMKMRGGAEIRIDNRWIVPYCPLLSRLFDAHINVEYCNSVKSIKYICSYINKGSDQATFAVTNINDEVTVFQTGRYISTSEAIWRTLEFPIHERHPTVVHLQVHLENGQRVYFSPNDDPQRILNQPPKSTLLAFFDLCEHDDFAKTLLYNEVPQYYTLSTQKKFQRRKIGTPVDGYPGIFKSDALGRVYTVHPNNRECYFLRLLLHTVPGPTSFMYLKTVNDVVYPNFESVCKALGLLENDDQWSKTLEEAALCESPRKLRHLFAIMLTMCYLSDAAELWETHKDNLSEDFFHRLQDNDPNQVTKDFVYNETLILLENILLKMGDKKLRDFGLPEPLLLEDGEIPAYNAVQLADFVQENEPRLTDEQRSVYDEILKSVNEMEGKIFFLDAPGGTGKTFITNLLLAKIRSLNKIAIATASSGIAATLLQGGKTVHSAFKLPFNLHVSENPVCNISKGTKLAKMLQECSPIVWDECTMSHKMAVETVDRTLRDLRGNNKVMGGVTVLFSGDFRQTLPVIPRGTRADEVNACLKSSVIWPKLKTVSLKTNMRVHLHNDGDAEIFAKILLDIGEAKINSVVEGSREIKIPEEIGSMAKDVEDLISNVYPDLQNLAEKPSSWLCERAILCARNDAVNALNEELLCRWNAEQKSYKSVDTVLNADDAVTYPVEFLNSLDLPGLPPHQLDLKVGSPIMLLRNLDAPRLCNGTRLRVIRLQDYVIEAEILTGCARGEVVFIPRIPLSPSPDVVYEFRRLQFPVRLCFAMTINKAQGQSLTVAGIDLRHPCFSHGQLYVALSRVSRKDSLHILVNNGRKTANIVYTEVLR